MIQICDSIRAALPHVAVSDEGGEVILSPRSTEEVAAVLSYCNEQKLRVQIAGAGTKRWWSGQRRADVVLKTSRLVGVREHPWQDLTATVGSGTPWGEMQRVLGAWNQFVALDPLWPENATVGGVLSTNDSGAIRLRYGSARDLVIGMTIVLADGTIAKTGGKVVKNVAGYDLHKLMIGAFGTLAVITEITFRLHPVPASRALQTIVSREVEPLARLVTDINKSHLNAEAIQIRSVAEGFHVDVLLAAAPEVLRPKEQDLAAMAAAQGLLLREQEHGLDLLRARESMFGRKAAVIAKITAAPTSNSAILSEVARSGGEAVGYPLGIIFASFSDPDAIAGPVRGLVEAGGGSITIMGQPAEHTALMREIRSRFGAERFV